MTEKPNEDTEAVDLSRHLRKVLDSHGYGFQYRVVEEIDKLYREERSKWQREVAEYPVSIGRFETRIDCVLTRHDQDLILIGECKRAHPAFSNWCFVKVPFMRNEGSFEPELNEVVLEEVQIEHIQGSRPRVLSTKGVYREYHDDTYHIGFELKRNGSRKHTDNTSHEPAAAGRKAIEDALGQVSKGCNGLVKEFTTLGPPPWAKDGPRQICFRFLPVIFTTARLWTSDVKLSMADLATGELPPEEMPALEQKSWIMLQDVVSPSIKHGLGTDLRPDRLRDVLIPEYVRSVAIVNANGIEEFLRFNFN